MRPEAGVSASHVYIRNSASVGLHTRL